MPKEMKIGVVGCGYWGPNLVRNFRAFPDCNLKMICDLSEQRLAHLKSVYPEVQGTTDYRHMLNGAGLDAVVIATAVSTHFPMARRRTSVIIICHGSGNDSTRCPGLPGYGRSAART